MPIRSVITGWRLLSKTHHPKAVSAAINWRRNDQHVEEKALFIVDSATNKRLLNVSVTSINRETCTLLFEPVAGGFQIFCLLHAL